MTFQSWQLNPPKNLYGFQGQEYQEELGWHQYKWRNADPALGRFFNVDPLAEEYHYWTPYAFSGNMVTRHVELEGLEPVEADVQQSMQNGIAEGALNLVTSTAESIWFLMKAYNPWSPERQQLKEGIKQGATALGSMAADPYGSLTSLVSTAETEFESFRRASDEERAYMIGKFGGEVGAGMAFEGAVGPILKSLDVAGDVAQVANKLDNVNGTIPIDDFGKSVLLGGGKNLPMGVPSLRNVKFDWQHIFDGHSDWGSIANQSGAKTVFEGLDANQIQEVVTGAYQNVIKHRKSTAQQNMTVMRGTYKSWTVEMWVNRETKVVETAYPVGQ